MEHLSYIATILFFAGGLNGVLWAYDSKSLRSQWRQGLLFALILGLLFGPTEAVALSWGAWAYNPMRTLNQQILGAEVETYFLAFAVSLAIFNCTLVFSSYFYTKSRQKK